MAVQLPLEGTGWSWIWYTGRRSVNTPERMIGKKKRCDELKGPRDSSGKPETEMAKLTPVPFALEVPATKPRILDVVRLGKKAV